MFSRIERRTFGILLGMGFYALTTLACLYTRHDIHITLDIRQIQDTASSIEDIVAGDKDIEDLETQEGAMLDRGPGMPFLSFATAAQAAGALEPKQITDSLKKNIESRKARHAQIRKLKTAGLAGENNLALLEVPPGASADAATKKIIKAENADRMKIYKEIAAQNNATDDAAFAKVRHAWAAVNFGKSQSGDWIQVPSGAKDLMKFLKTKTGRKLKSKPKAGSWVKIP